MPGLMLAGPSVLIQSLMWGMTLDPQTSFSRHPDERFRRREEYCSLAVYQNWTTLHTRQKPPAHSKKTSHAALSKQPPQHFWNAVVYGKTSIFFDAGNLTEPNARVLLTDSGNLSQTVRHLRFGN